MPRIRSLSIRFIKPGTNDADIFKPDLTLRSMPLIGGLSFTGDIYFKPSANKTPGWVTFLNSGAPRPIRHLFSAQASALLLVKTKRGRFAISFGHAWQWLNENAIERRFGLLAALNCIEDDQIKVVDAQQIDSLALSRRAQASHSSDLVAFGLDVRRDLMKAIVGRPKSADIGKTIMGADALRVTTKIEFADVGNKCDQLFVLSRKEDYKTNYGWIDNIEIVKNPDEKKQLDAILLRAINSRDTEGMFLAPPRIKDLTSDEEYRFHFDKGRDENRFDIEIEELMTGIEHSLPINLDFLKHNRIEVYAAGSPYTIDSFSIYSGIVFEANRGNRLSCLIDGDWYNVSNSHVNYVNSQLSQITKSAVKLPDAKNSEKEGDYNIRAAKALNASCMDKRMITYGGGANKIEVCDVLTNDPCFIHVKKANSSQVLSHLFNQGVVAGQFLLEEDFREECIKKADPAYKNLFSTYAADKVTITFGIISKRAEKLPEQLPFFSKQTLINAASLLKKFSYKVELRGIKVV